MKSVPVFCSKDCGGNSCPLLLEIEGGHGVRLCANPAGGRYIKACRRGFDLLKEHYAPDRLTRPLIRTGPRGSGSFREAGWDEALDLVAARLKDIRARHGASSVLCLASSGCTGALHGTQTLTKRFLNVTGGCTVFFGNYSWGAARAVLPYLFGTRWTAAGTDAATMQSSRMVILWGSNLLDTRQGAEMPRRLLEAKQRGVPIIVIDPRRTTTVRRAGTWWIPCRPGTDAALMLAVLHVLLSDGLVDLDRVRALSTGFDSLARLVLGQDGGAARTPAWAERICGVPAAETGRFARAWSAARPAMLIPGFSIQRVFAGEETYRLTAALQLATGNFGVRGGSTGSLNNIIPSPRVGSMGAMMSPHQVSIPVLRWPDAILEGRSGGYPSDIHAVYMAGGNLLNQGGDVRKAMAAFAALDFAVCHELFLTPTARNCDVVLPTASALEKEDIGLPWLGNYLLYKPAALSPVGSTRSDWDIFCDLADRMGAGREYSGGRSAAQWVDAFLRESEVPDHDEFRRTGVYLAPEQERVGLEDFARDPLAHPLDTPSGKVEIESRRYARETGFPALPDWRGREADERYPLSLVTPKRAEKTHSQLGNRASPLGPSDHALSLHATDAARRGVGHGDTVRLFNQYGTVHVTAAISEDIMQGVVSLHEGVWAQLDEKGEDRAGSANVLTDTEGTDPSAPPSCTGCPSRWPVTERPGKDGEMPRVDTAVILCGGKSSRAGIDKQLIPCEGTTLPKAIARKLQALFREIIIVTSAPDLYAGSGLVVVRDIVEGAGPLGGIFTGLAYASGEYAYVTAGDMPHTNLRYIEWMTTMLEQGDVTAVATREGSEHIEPFNSIFAARCASLMEASLARGVRSVSRFLRGCNTTVLVAEEDARLFSPDWSMFASINTRADVQRFLTTGATA